MENSDQGIDRRGMLKLMAGAGVALAAAPALTTRGLAQAVTRPSASAAVKLTFWDTNAAPIRTPYWKHLLAQFEAANKGIQVEYVGIPESQYVEKIQTAIAGGQVPDVANPGVQDISPFIGQNGLLPLDKYFAKWSGKSTFPAKVVSATRSVAYDNKLYALPYSGNVNVLYYRKDLFSKAGLSAPTTWDNLYKAASALTNPAQNLYGFGMRGGSGSVTTLESWLYAATGITQYFDKKGHATLNHPAMVSALKQFTAMYGKQTAKADLNNDYLQMSAEFDAGHSAMMFHNLGSYPGHVTALGAANVGVTVLPPAKSTGKTTLDGQSYLGNIVFKGSAHPAEAWKLVAFLGNSASQSYFNQNIGQIPVDKAGSSEAWVKSNVAVQAAEVGVNGKNTVLVNPPFYLPAYTVVQQQMEPQFQKVLLGQLSEKSFLDSWASQINTAEAQYKKAHKKG